MRFSFISLTSVLFFIFFSAVSFSLDQIPGSQDYYAGFGVKELSLGYTGISELGSLDGNSFNPASLGDLRRMANSLSVGGIGSSDFLLSAGFAYPTGFGVLSINGLYKSDSAPDSLSSLAGLQLNIAKPITENLFWGLDVKYGQGGLGNTNDWQLGGDMGIILRDKTEGQGLGFFDPSYGIVLKNIGKTIKLGSYDPLPAMGLGAGMSFYPVKYDFYQMKISGDVVVPVNPFNLLLNLGLENSFFDFIKIRAGYTLSSSSLGNSYIGPFQAGVAITGKIAYSGTNSDPASLQLKSANARLDNSTDIELAYALQRQNYNGKYELAHFVNLSVAWGYYSTRSPDVAIKPDIDYFSPDTVSRQGRVCFSLDIKDTILIDGWEMRISDRNGSTVKTFKNLDKLQIRTLTPGKFLRQLFSSREAVEIPKSLTWDGHDENGARVPDGEYTYTLKARDENNNTGETLPGKVIVDTIPPKTDPSLPYFVFSVNKDSIKQELPIYIKSANIENGDKIHAAIIDSQSNEIKSFDFESTAPQEIIWDGKDNRNEIAREGVYGFFIKAWDRAGNNTEKIISGIRLVTNYESVTLDASDNIFSPNNDGIKDTVTFRQKVSSERGLEEWRFRIYDPQSNIVREFNGDNNLSSEIVWDGRDKKNNTLPDGIYSYNVQLRFDSGNHPSSEGKKIRIKTTPPYIVIKPEYMSFSPNNAQAQNTIAFDNTIQGDSDDIFNIRIIDFTGNLVYYNSYRKTDFPEKFVWNGRNKDLEPLPEGKYTYIVEGEDNVGNRDSKEIRGIMLKTGLEKVSIQSDLQAFSPKNKATNKISFISAVSSKDNIVEFELAIRDDKNNTVKSIKTNCYIDRIDWNGTDNYKNLARDGEYSYQLRVKYDYGNEMLSAVKYVKLLSTAPLIDLGTDDRIFSPNGDGNKETFIIKQHTRGNPDNVYEGAIKDNTGRTVRSYKWTGSIPDEIVWDGTDDKNNPAGEGYYKYEIKGSDIAGNVTLKTTDKIKLVREFEKLTFTSDVKAFSPNGNGAVKFTHQLSSIEDLGNSSLYIYDSTGNRVRRIFTNEDLDREIAWDGKNDKGVIQPDGRYNAEMVCTFDSGNIIKGAISNIIVDKSPPSYKLSVSPDLFTPDGDGENDKLYISLELSSLAGIRSWEIGIYKKMDDGNRGRIFKSFSGTNDTVRQIQWDGNSDDGQDLVESVQDYVLELKAEDNVGNILTNVQRVINIGVLVEKTPDGLRIRVSSIQFAFDKADLIGNSERNLDRVIYIIRRILSDRKKYGITENYKIEVSGHTDDIGTDEYNQKLSMKRAEAVYQYLIMKDIDPLILTFAGYGKTRPYKIITPDMSKEKKEEYRTRNRRVEFFIRK